MAKFKRSVSVDMEALAKAPKSAGSIPTSGLYSITLKALTVDVSPWGTTNVGMFIEVGGNSKMMYSVLDLGPEDTSGLEKWQQENYAKSWKLLDRVFVVSGADPESITDTETVALPIGKEGANKDVEILEGLPETELQAWFKFEYYKSKEGEIKERIALKEIFTDTGFTADEVLRKETEPVRIHKLENYFDAVSYKSELTAEDVNNWIANGRNATPKTSAPRPTFGKKFGAK